MPPSSLQLRLLLLLLQQRQGWCVLTSRLQQGLCCCSTGGRQGPACLPGFSSPPSLVRLARPAAGAGRNVSTSLFCKNLGSPGLPHAGPSRAEFELRYFMSEYLH